MSVKFKGKAVSLKIDNALNFKLLSAGVHKGDFLIVDGADALRFSKAWSIALGVNLELPKPDFAKCKTDAAKKAEAERIKAETEKCVAKFINGFSDLYELNALAVEAINRDTPQEPLKKKSPTA